VIECLLSLRADPYHKVGVYDRSTDMPLQYSPYVTCDSQEGATGAATGASTPPRSPTSTAPPAPSVNMAAQWLANDYLNYTTTFSLFMQCLETVSLTD